MPLRRILLRTLLACLASAAVCGVLAVMAGGYGALSRVLAVALLAAGAALAMIGCSFLVDRPLTHGAGLLGMAFAVVEFLLLTAIVWLDVGANVESIAIVLPLVVVPAMASAAMSRAGVTRFAGWIGLASCAAVLALFVGGLFAKERPWRDENPFFALSGTVATFAPLVVLCLVGAGTDRRHWRWAGVFAAVVGGGGMFHAFVYEPKGGEVAFGVVISVAMLAAHANVLVRVALTPAQGWVRVGTFAAAGVAALFVDLAIAAPPAYDDGSPADAFKRVAGAASIVAACGTLAVIVFALLNRRAARPSVAMGAIRAVTLTCPSCERRQTVPVGEARCAQCRLIIHTRFDEPRCANCDYSLLMLQADRCPECGTAVPVTSDVAPTRPAGQAANG